jgi:hypothetical protein
MNPTVKGAIKSKTMWIAALVTAVGVIEANQSSVIAFLPAKWQGLAVIGMGITFGVLRIFTAQSLADKGTPQ